MVGKRVVLDQQSAFFMEFLEKLLVNAGLLGIRIWLIPEGWRSV